jgi:uncharacterized membrane protein YgaE (UPF0421/DUF939 family)
MNDQHPTGFDRPSLAEILRSCPQRLADRGRFVARCTIAASLAEVIAAHVGLPHPVWAPVSALVVTQESVAATLSSGLGRLVGTVIGVTVAMIVHRLGAPAHISLVPQLAVAVAICALCTSGRPAIRVCLWKMGRADVGGVQGWRSPVLPAPS